MIGRRKRPDGLPFNLYMFVGKRIISFGYKPADKWIFRLRAPRVQKDKVAQIRAEAIRRAEALNGDTVAAGTVSDLIARYFAWQEGLLRTDERRKADVTLKENQREAKNLEAFFGDMMPPEVRPVHIYEYLDMRAEGGAPAKANKEIGLLSAIFEYGRRKGELETNPCNDIEYNPVRPKSKLVSAAEVDFMVEVARARGGQYLVMALCVKAAYLAVGRPEEMRNLRRQNLKQDGVEIPVGKRRSGHAQKFRAINWSDKLRATIDEALTLQKTTSIYVFGNVRGQPYNRNSWGNNWAKLMRFCEIAAEKEGAAFSRFTLSDMRPRAVTKRMEGGDTAITDATGHSSDRMAKKTYDRRAIKRADATE